jgi:hypothetical protein
MSVVSQRTRVEQAIARGWAPQRIAHELAVPLTDVLAVWDVMDAAAHEDDDPAPYPPLFTWEGRPISSFFGPAPKHVIDELVDALVPPQPHRRDNIRGRSAA